MPYLEDPRYSVLGIPDAAPVAEADRFYQSLPDMGFLQARGIVPPTATGMNGYVDPYAPGAMVDQQQQMRSHEDEILSGMKKLDPTAPDYHTKLEGYFADHPDPNAVMYPRVQNAIGSSLAAHKDLQAIFQRSPKLRAYYGDLAGKMSVDEALPLAEQISLNEPKDVSLRGEYHTAINDLVKGKKSVDPEDVAAQLAIRHGLAASGIDPAEFVKNGKINPTDAALAIARAKVGPPTLRPITDTEEKTLSRHMDALDAAKEYEPDQKAKQALIDSGKAKDWTQAYDILKKGEIDRATVALKRKVNSYHASNIAVPPDFYEAAGLNPDDFSFNNKGKPVRTAAGKETTSGADALADLPPVDQSAAVPATAAPAAPVSLYTVPGPKRETTDAETRAQLATDEKSADKAVETNLLTQYSNAGKSITDAAHDLDRLTLELAPFYGVGSGAFEHAYRGEQKAKDVLADYLKANGMPATPVFLKGLDQILGKRQRELSAATSAKPNAAPAAAPSPIKSIKLVQK